MKLFRILNFFAHKYTCTCLACAPLCCKNLSCASGLRRVVRELRAEDPRQCARGHEANASSGTQRPENAAISKARKISKVRGRHGGVEKGGGWKTSRMTPLPKRGFGPPLVWYVFHPPHVSVLCFSCTEIHDRADQKLFCRGQKNFGRARSLVRFPPPIRFAPPHITAQQEASIT